MLLLLVHTITSCVFFFLMIRRPPRSTLDRSSAASDVYKRQETGVSNCSLRRTIARITLGCQLSGQSRWLVVDGDNVPDVQPIPEERGVSVHQPDTAVGREVPEARFRRPVVPVQCVAAGQEVLGVCLLYTSPSPRDRTRSRMPSSA